MSPPTKPTIVLVPGAWQPSSLYTPLILAFQSAGFPALIVDLPSCDPQVHPQSTTTTIDSDAIRKIVLPLIEQEGGGGKDMVLLCHSYGGVPLGPAAAGLSKSIRGSARGGVVGLVYMCAAMVAEKATMLDAIGGTYFPYMIPGSVIPPLLSPFAHNRPFPPLRSFILEALHSKRLSQPPPPNFFSPFLTTMASYRPLGGEYPYERYGLIYTGPVVLESQNSLAGICGVEHASRAKYIIVSSWPTRLALYDQSQQL